MSRISQIRNIRDKCKSINPVSPNDDTRWFIQLVDKNMQELYKIFVYIPRDFPTAPPQITLSTVLDHPWVNHATKVVQHPQLIHWDPVTDLAAVLLDVLREFTTKKPTLLNDDSVLRRGSLQSSTSQSAPGLVEVVGMPAIPSEFPELKTLPLDTLEAFDRDTVKLDAYVDSMAILVKYREMKDSERTATFNRAQESLRVKDRIDDLQRQIDSDFENIGLLRSGLEKLMQERDSILSHYTPKFLLKDLYGLADKAEAESASFIQASDGTDDAKSKYLQQRILYHKAMALSELLTVHSGSRILGSPRSATR